MGVFRHAHFGTPTKAPRPRPDPRLTVPPAARPKPGSAVPPKPSTHKPKTQKED